MEDVRRKRGQAGEDLAVRYLESQGLKLVERNYRTRQGEIDVIAEEGPFLVFVEVKSRTSEDYERPAQSVTRAKRKKLSEMAVQYVSTHNIGDRPCRFDILEVLLDENRRPRRFNLIRNAFELSRSVWG